MDGKQLETLLAQKRRNKLLRMGNIEVRAVSTWLRR